MLSKWIKGLAFFGTVLILWYIFSRNANPLFFPKPELVWKDMVDLFENGMMQKGLVASFMRITIATLITSAISIPLGLLVANYEWVDRLITPATAAARYIPVTVTIPLLFIWMGIGEKMKITFLCLATLFFFLPTVVLTVKETSRELIDTAYTLGMKPVEVMAKVLLPSSLPVICENFLMMYGIGWNYVIIVETLNATAGLGYIMNLGQIRGRTDLVFAALIVVLIISVLFDKAGQWLIHKVFPWKYARAVQS